jgi:hypothetical protein
MNTPSALIVLSVLFVACQEAKTPSIGLQGRDLVTVVRQECAKSVPGDSCLKDYEDMVESWDSIHVLTVPQGILDSVCIEARPLLLIESGGTRAYIYKCWMVAECASGPVCISVTLHGFGGKSEVTFFPLGPEQFSKIKSSLVEGTSGGASHSEFAPSAIDGSYDIVTVWDGTRPRYFLATDLRLERLEESSSLRWLSALADTVFWSRDRERN